MNLKALAAPFPASEILWRVGRTSEDGKQGQALPYIVSRAVQARLDEVVGPDKWRNNFSDVVTGNRHVAVRCSIAIFVNDRWVDKEDGAQVDANLGNNAEVAVKGAYSDAFKRAAVMWGIGRYLYAFQAPWVDLDDDGRMTSVPQLPAEMLPEGDTSVGTISPRSASSRAPSRPAPAAVAAESAPAPAPAQTQPAEATASAPAEQPVVVSAPAPAPATAPAVAAATTGGGAPYTEDELTALPERERQYVKSITTHLEKRTSLQNLRAYVNGPKMQQQLTEATRARLTALIDAAIGQQEMSAQA